MKKLTVFLVAITLHALPIMAIAQADTSCFNEKLMQFEDCTIYNYNYQRSPEDSGYAIIFKENMNIDADGSPRAYGPDNSGLDWTANGGKPGNWWAIVTDNGQKDGNPIIQRENDPFPGMYVCTTSLHDSTHNINDPLRYVNAEHVPYISLPLPVRQRAHISIGGFVWVFNTETGKSSYAIYADAGGNKGIGEGSMFLAESVGLKNNPKTGGGTDKNIIIYVVLPGTTFGQGYIPTSIQIQQRGLQLLSPEQTTKIAQCNF